MEFTDFVDNFKDVLRKALCEFCEKEGLVCDYYYYTVEDEDLVTFEAVLWYDCKLWEKPYKMYIDFFLENREKDIVIEAEAGDRVRTITIDKTSEKVDWLKDTIIEWIEELLYEDLEKLEKRLASLEFYYKIKDLIDEYNWRESWYGISVEIGRSKVGIWTEYVGGELYLEEISIHFEKKEECVIFADFIEKSVNIDKTKVTVDLSLREVSIDLGSFKPKERLDIVRKVIEALEMMYLF